MHCEQVGIIYGDLILQEPLCPSHYSLLKRLETKQEKYFATRNRVREQQKTASLSRFVKTKARYATTLAIKAGGIEKTPCTVCGEVSSETHHFDYNDPMNVTFLCTKHHKEWHRNNSVPKLIVA